ICDTHVDPASGSWTLDPGQKVHETKQVFVNSVVPRGDVVMAMDLTESMANALAQLQKTTNQILTAVSPKISDVQVGLVSFEDYPQMYSSCGYTELYGDVNDVPYTLEVPVTADLPAVRTAIRGLKLRNGSDPPEAYTR